MERGSKIPIMLGRKEPRGIIPRDKFDTANVFCRAAIKVGFPIGLHREVIGDRGGLRQDVLALWISPTDAEKVDNIYRLVKQYSPYHLVKLVDLGFASKIQDLMERPGEYYQKHPSIKYWKKYDQKFLERCYMRAYDRRSPVFRNNLGYLSQPMGHDNKFLSLDQAHVEPIARKSLQTILAEAIDHLLIENPKYHPLS